MLITVAIPCYRSEKMISAVVADIRNEFEKHDGYDYQIVLVNDGSPDKTFDVIKTLCQKDTKIVGVNLSRNFGQAAAKMAAIPYVKGEILVYMDDDGQHPVEEMFKLIERVESGDDLVCAYFKKKEHNWFKRFTSSVHSRLLSYCTKKPKDFHTSSYMAISRFCVDALMDYHSPFATMGGFLFHITTKISNVEMSQMERKEGKSGYSLMRMISLWVNSVTNFSVVPLRLATYIGFVFAFLGILMGVVIVLQKIMNPATVLVGYTSLMSVILLCSGTLMFMLGLIGEYIGRMFMIMNDLPQYEVRTAVNVERRVEE